MSNMQRTHSGWRVLSVLPLALIAAIGGAVPAHAQSSGAPDTAASAKAPKESASQRTTASTAPGPFTYDAVGATPKVRIPKKPATFSPKVKATASPNPAGSDKTSQHDAVNATASPTYR